MSNMTETEPIFSRTLQKKSALVLSIIIVVCAYVVWVLLKCTKRLYVPSYLILTQPDMYFLVFLLFSLCDPFGNSGLESQELPRVKANV